MYKLSAESLEKLKGVHPDLVKVVKRAIELTTIDFKVGEGVRTPARQKKLVAEGKSKTLNSRHIPGKDGFGK
ncbi:MAG: M15 family peptidase, partial [Verrucomicrobiaceae bacterium]